MPESSRAEPDTLFGLIERGRGACYDAALAQPALAREFVLDCIVGDPRRDHQVEQRDWLYATLVAELGIDLSRLRAAIAAQLVSAPAKSMDQPEWEAALLAIATDLLHPQDFPLPVRMATRRCLARLNSPRALAWARANAALDSDAGPTAIAMITDFAERQAIECLYDCESETRTLAIAHASTRIPEVRESIRGIAEDPSEEEGNRRAAAARILLWR
ncbi:hypothetical protein [Nocardia nepalensis]|uniref:hypothetical protein n=1 Tax=Nocardia nepalensis TaxID=3375448 RepID=UPI003B66FC69